jgi:hypothetical protein
MAIALDKDQILIGAIATLELGTADLGPTTEDGVTVNVEQEFKDIMVDQYKGVIDKKLTKRRVTIGLTLAEADIANFHKALNLASSALSASSLTINMSQATATTLLIAGVAPAAKTRTFIFDLVYQVGNVSHVMKKNEEVGLAVEFEAMYNPTNTRFGIVGDAA